MIEQLDENIINVDQFYIRIQRLQTDKFYNETNDFLNEIIQSKFHFWQGNKYPDGMTWTWSNGNSQSQYTGIKTFGLHDNNKIVPDHYKKIDFEFFESSLKSFIFRETEDLESQIKIKELIQEYKFLDMTIFKFYPDKLEKSKFSVYSSFIAFILVKTGLKKAIRIECGED